MRESLSKPGDFVLSILTDQLKPGADAPPAGASNAAGAPLKVTHIKIMCEVSSWESKEGGVVSAADVLKGRGPVSLSTPNRLSELGSKCCHPADSNLSDAGHCWVLSQAEAGTQCDQGLQ